MRISGEVVMKLRVEEAIEDVMVPGMVGMLVPGTVDMVVPGMVGMVVSGMVGMVLAMGGKLVVPLVELMPAEVTGATEVVDEA